MTRSKDTRIQVLAAIACSVALIAAITLAGIACSDALAYDWPPMPAMHGAPASVTLPDCEEDQPCFTWSTMGNLSRGLYLRTDAGHDWRDYAIDLGASRVPWSRAYYIVDASVFCRLSHRHAIDWSRSKRLKGDGIARTSGCDPRYFAQPAS